MRLASKPSEASSLGPFGATEGSYLLTHYLQAYGSAIASLGSAQVQPAHAAGTQASAGPSAPLPLAGHGPVLYPTPRTLAVAGQPSSARDWSDAE